MNNELDATDDLESVSMRAEPANLVGGNAHRVCPSFVMLESVDEAVEIEL